MPPLHEQQSSRPPTSLSPGGLADEDVRHVAKLSRLAILDAQVHQYAQQLKGILSYVAKIGEVDIEGVPPTAHAIQMRNVLREDVVGPMLSLEQVLQNTADADPPFFKVPKVIGSDEDSAG